MKTSWEFIRYHGLHEFVKRTETIQTLNKFKIPHRLIKRLKMDNKKKQVIFKKGSIRGFLSIIRSRQEPIRKRIAEATYVMRLHINQIF